MHGSVQSGLVAATAGCSPNLAEHPAPSAPEYRTARPGSTKRVGPGQLLEAAKSNAVKLEAVRFDAFTTNGTMSNVRTLGSRTRPFAAPAFTCHFVTAANLLVRRADVLFRSGPEITHE
jgi:hypothetical protein